MSDKSVLVVYYSRTGTTAKLGKSIAQELRCDSEAIVREREQKGFFGWWVCGFEAFYKRTPAIKPVQKDPSAFDLVIIGSPVWAGTVASPARTYLAAHAQNFKKVAFFSTAGSQAEPRIFMDMESVCSRVPLVTLLLPAEEVWKNAYVEKMKSFIEAILEKL
jgi:menaquinone-dependent protoporphyrinogen IX oxidase